MQRLRRVDTDIVGELSHEMSYDFNKLLEYGLDPKVAHRLDDIFKTEKLSHSDLDERALVALKDLPVEDALAVLEKVQDSELEHVINKSAFLCGVMRTWRQKTRAGASSAGGGRDLHRGPDEEKIKVILLKTRHFKDKIFFITRKF